MLSGGRPSAGAIEILLHAKCTHVDCRMFRLRDAAMLLHKRGPRVGVRWAGIANDRLSTHDGEFCKLFFEHTHGLKGYNLDIFDQSEGAEHQLLQILDTCNAFSGEVRPGFCSLFNISPANLKRLKSMLHRLRVYALGESSEMEPSNRRSLREMARMHANEMALDADFFVSLIACAKNLLECIPHVLFCIDEDYMHSRFTSELVAETALQALGEIERLSSQNFDFDDLYIPTMSNVAAWPDILDYASIVAAKALNSMVHLCLRNGCSTWKDTDCDTFFAIAVKRQALWIEAGLPPVPDVLLMRSRHFSTRETCDQILDYVRAVLSYGSTQIKRIRVMMVGLGEVGKTRLVKALRNDRGNKREKPFTSAAIDKEHRTVAADISEFELIPSVQSSPRLTACVWDFAGQEVYYMAHSLFLSHLAVYVLVWKRPDSVGKSLDPAKAGLRRWIEMIGLYAPDAKIVIVGTHCATCIVGPDQSLDNYQAEFLRYSAEIKEYVQSVVQKLNSMILREDEAIMKSFSSSSNPDLLLRRRGLLRGIRKSSVTFEDIVKHEVCQMSIDKSFFAIDSATGDGVRDLSVHLDKIGRLSITNVVVPNSYSLIEKCMAHCTQPILTKNEAVETFVRFFQAQIIGSLRISADGSSGTERSFLPPIGFQLVEKTDLNQEPAQAPHPIDFDASARGSDSITGIESVPRTREDDSIVSEGGGIKSQDDGVKYEDGGIKSQDGDHESEDGRLKSENSEDDSRLANSMSPDEIWQGFMFWGYLGYMYVCSSADGQNDFVVPKPQVLLDFLKPLVHMRPIDMMDVNEKASNDSSSKASVGNESFLVPYQSGSFLSKDQSQSIEDDVYIRKVLLRLSSEHCIIQRRDLGIFKVWKSLKSDSIFRDLLNLFRKESILYFENDQDSVLTVTARIHVTPGSYLPFDLQFFLVYLLPLDNVSLLVYLRNAFCVRMKNLNISIKHSCFRSGLASVYELKRNDEKWCQIVVRPASEMTKDNEHKFNLLSEVYTGRFSCVLSLTCDDRSSLSFATSCISEALLEAYPFFDIIYWMSTKHINYRNVTSSQIPWVNLSTLSDSPAFLCDLVSKATARGHIQVYDGCDMQIDLPCSAMFPVLPQVVIIAHADRRQDFIEFLESFRVCMESAYLVPIEVFLVGVSKGSLDSAKIVIVCLTPDFICDSVCMALLQRLIDCSAGNDYTKNRNSFYVVSLHPSVTLRGICNIIYSDGLLLSAGLDGKVVARRLGHGCVSLIKCLQSRHIDAEVRHNNFPVFWDDWCLFFEDSAPKRQIDEMWSSSTHSKEMMLSLEQKTYPYQLASSSQIINFRWELEPYQTSPEHDDVISIYDDFTRSYDYAPDIAQRVVERLVIFGFSNNEILKGLSHANSDNASLEYIKSFEFAHSCFRLDLDAVKKQYVDYRRRSSIIPLSSARLSASSESQSPTSVSWPSSSSSFVYSLCLEGDSVSSLDASDDDTVREIALQCCEICSKKGLRIMPGNISLFRELRSSSSRVEWLVLINELDCNASDFHNVFLEHAKVNVGGNSFNFQVAKRDAPDELVNLKNIFAEHGVSILPPSQIRRGGTFGDVYKCEYNDPLTRRRENIAAKLCDAKTINMDDVYDEGRLLGLCHTCPNIVRCIKHFVIYDSSRLPTHRVILMEWLEYGDFGGLLKNISESGSSWRISDEIFSRFYSQILGAVCFLHKEQPQKPCILHRDIKPENILIQVENDVSCQHDHLDFCKVTLKLSDLGLSKSIESGPRMPSDFSKKGTAPYKSPESFLGRPSCTGDDVWSTAIVLVEMMCGCSRIDPRTPRILVEQDTERFGRIFCGVDQLRIRQQCVPKLAPFIEPVLAALNNDSKYRCTNAEELLAALNHCKENIDSMKDVFICHHPDDVEFAQKIEVHLSECRLKVHRASLGEIVTKLCNDMLLAAAKYARPYLEYKLRELHQLVFDFAGAHELIDILKNGPDEHSWDSKTMSIEPNASVLIDRILLGKIDLENRFSFVFSETVTKKEGAENAKIQRTVVTEISDGVFELIEEWTDGTTASKRISLEEVKKTSIFYRVLHKLISDKAGEYGTTYKLANANMKNIADPNQPRNGWFELGKMFTSSSGTHATAIKKTSIENLDIEATFNILHNIGVGVIPQSVRDLSKTLVQFRHQGSAHKETRYLGETSFSVAANVMNGIRSFAECLDQHHLGLDTDDLYQKIADWETRKQEAIFQDVLILLQSRFVVPVISPRAIEEWQKIHRSTKYDPVLLYTCAGFAALEMAKCSRKMSSRVENIFPVIPKGIWDSKDFEKSFRCFPDFFDNCSSRMFHTTPGNCFIKYEDSAESRRIHKIVNGVIFCPNHCLSPNSCISLTGNLENVTIVVVPEQSKQASQSDVFFVIEDGFSADAFKLSLTLGEKRHVLFETGDSYIGFKLASALLFQSFRTKTLKETWQMIKDFKHLCCPVESWNEACADGVSGFLKDKLCVRQEECCCKFEVLQVLDSRDDKNSREIVRLRVKLLAASGIPFQECEFHEIPQINSTQVNPVEMRKTVGTCIFVRQDPGEDSEFEIGLVLGRGFTVKKIKKIRKLCSCSVISQHADDRLSQFKRVLYESNPHLVDVRKRILALREQENWAVLSSFKNEIQDILNTHCTKILGASLDGPSINVKDFLAECTSLYTCVTSIRVKLRDIEETKKQAENQKARFEEAFDQMTQGLRDLSETHEFQELCRVSDFVGLKKSIRQFIGALKCNYCGDFGDDKRQYASANHLKGTKLEYDLLKNERSYEPTVGVLSVICRRLGFLNDVKTAADRELISSLKSHLEGLPDFEKLKKCHELKEKVLAPLREKYGLEKSIAAKDIFILPRVKVKKQDGLSVKDARIKVDHTENYAEIPRVKKVLDSVPVWVDKIFLLLNKSETDDPEYQAICREIEAAESTSADPSLIEMQKRRKSDIYLRIKKANDDLMILWTSAIKEFKDWHKKWLTSPSNLTQQQLKQSDGDGNFAAPQRAGDSAATRDDDAASRVLLHRFLSSASIVPLRQLDVFVEALAMMGLGGDECLLREILLDGFDFAYIGMRPTQINSLLRYLRLPAAFESSGSFSIQRLIPTEEVAKAQLVDVLARAMLLPASKREHFAEKLYDSGIGDEVALRECLLSDPPCIDLSADVGMNPIQKRVMLKYFKL